jgi:RHS repeat-associated protein
MAKLGPGGNHSIVTDYLGTPVSMLDESGQQVWSADINTFGRLRNLEGDAQACPFRWPGQYEDAETGLYYNRYRYYDPDAGQYVSQDPIGLLGGPRMYGYVNEPLTWVDPRGLSACGAQQELSALGPLHGKARAEIEQKLRVRGFTSAPAHSGGKKSSSIFMTRHHLIFYCSLLG